MLYGKDAIWKIDSFLLSGENNYYKMIREDHERMYKFLEANYLINHGENEKTRSELTKETAKWMYHELDNELTALKIIKLNSTNEKKVDELENLIQLEKLSFRLYKRNSINISKSREGGINFWNDFLLYYSKVGVYLFDALNLKEKSENSSLKDYKKIRGYFKSVYDDWEKVNKEKIPEERIIGFLDNISDKGWSIVKKIKRGYNNNLPQIRNYLKLLDKVICAYDEIVLRDTELRNKNIRKKRKKL